MTSLYHALLLITLVHVAGVHWFFVISQDERIRRVGTKVSPRTTSADVNHLDSYEDHKGGERDVHDGDGDVTVHATDSPGELVVPFEWRAFRFSTI